ncbi:MAG TPA: hypothetical protein VKB53_09735, partial [Gammaproteobacteria bacterium]|nr:hypothetical protein [Gammaproteobacteria bacterium]
SIRIRPRPNYSATWLGVCFQGCDAAELRHQHLKVASGFRRGGPERDQYLAEGRSCHKTHKKLSAPGLLKMTGQGAEAP